MALNQQSDSIENYEVYENIGCGGFANVYRAHSVERGRDVAIKFIERKKMRDQQTLKRVESEVKIHSRLKHPYVLELFSFFFDESYIYLVLELCHNGDLGSYLKKQSKLPVTEEEACHYLRPIVEAIVYLHKHRIIHRDLKLSNILLTKDMTVKLGDFGVATQLSQPEEQHFTMCGTPNYISPEVATRKPHGLPVDVWSIGCMLFNLLVGEPPFHSPEVRNTLERVISVDYHLPENLSEDAKDLIRSLLREAPKERSDLEQILQHPFFAKKVLSSSSGFDDGVDEISSADSGRDTLATLSGSLMTNASQSLSSSDSNCPPRSSASIDSSASPPHPEPTPSKVMSLARIFSSVEDATRNQLRPGVGASQIPQLQTPVRQFIGSTRPLQQRQSVQKQRPLIDFSDEFSDGYSSTPGPSGNNMHALCESCNADLGSNSPAPSPINGPNSGFSTTNPVTTRSSSGRTGQIAAISSSKAATAGQILAASSLNSARTGQIPGKTGSNSSAAGSRPATGSRNNNPGQKSAAYGQNSIAVHSQRTATHGRRPTALTHHGPHAATSGQNVPQGRSTPTTPVPGQGMKVKQTEDFWIQPNAGYYNAPGHYQPTTGNADSNRVPKPDRLSRRLEPVFDEMEMRQEMESPASNEGLESQPSRSTTPYSCFTDDNRFAMNLESNDQQGFLVESDGYLSGDGIPAGKYPLQHHHSDGNLFQVEGFEGCGHPPRGNSQLGRQSPLMVQKAMTLQRGREPRQTTLAMSRSRSVENLSGADGRRGQSRKWAAVSIDVDGQSQQQQQPNQRLVPPICAVRLAPTNQKTKCAVAHILEDGDVCLEFFQLCSGKYRVCQGLLVSPDGLTIKIYKLDSLLDPSLRPIPLSSSLGPCKKFLYSKLPQRYWKQYEYASRFVNLLRSETAKVVLYSDRGKAMLMENSPNPNFAVFFYDGAKFKVSSQETKIVQADGSSMTLQSTGSFAHLSPETQEMWHHVQTLHAVCKELDEFFTEKVSNKISCFPIVIRGTPSAAAMMKKMVEVKTDVDGNDSQPSSTSQQQQQQPMANGIPASERVVHDTNGPVATQSRLLRSTSSVNHGARTPVKMTERQQEAFVRNQPVQLRPMSGQARPEQRSGGQPSVPSQTNSGGDVQIVKEIYEPNIGKATEFSNGFIVVQHNEGYEIQLNTSLYAITFKDCHGRSKTFMKDDKLPMDIALLLTYMMEKLTNS